MNNELMFSSGTDEWETPAVLFDELHREFGFELDVAANAQNAKCATWYGEGGVHRDALMADWGTATCWMNPPYSRGRQARFIGKAWAAAAAGATVVALLPARTDTRAFHEYIWDPVRQAPRPGVEVRFLKGRVQFVGAPHGAPFPSMIVVFRPGGSDACTAGMSPDDDVRGIRGPRSDSGGRTFRVARTER